MSTITRCRQWCCGCDADRDFNVPIAVNVPIAGDDVQCLTCGIWMKCAVPPQKAEEPRAGHPGFYAILEEMAALHEKKASDYGLGKDVLANCRGSEEFGIPAWVGVVMRMNDKMTRLKSFAQKGVLANESAEDSLLDMACYSLIALILMREGKK